MGWLARVVCIFWGALLTARANYAHRRNNVPRLKLSYKEMLESHNVVTFHGLANSSSYHTFLLDEERGRLYVGAKDHIFSLSLVNIKDFQKIMWPVSYTRRDECKWAGKDTLKECANFIKVLKAYNETHLYACGTGAFHPVCTYIEVGHHPEDNVFKLEDSHFENGRGKSPYDPKLLTASLLVDGELYSGTAADFMGRDFAIFRTLGHHHPIRTEQHDSRWLNDPRFVSAHLIPESDNPEDDKVYFFFRENAIDGEHSGKATHARIGQICKNDFGGHRSLVNKWTTFLKARLICSVPGPSGIDTPFDELQDVFLMNSKDPKNPIVYGVFTTSSKGCEPCNRTVKQLEMFVSYPQYSSDFDTDRKGYGNRSTGEFAEVKTKTEDLDSDNIFKGSAVCMYSMSDVRRVFLGPYAHRDGPNYQWVPYQGRVPYPRPGTCPSKTFGGFDSTKDLPDDVITFTVSHPAMYNPVFPINNQPVMVKTDVNYQFTQIVVDRVDAEDGQYDVMFIGTDAGTVLKVVSIPKETWHDLEEVLLEEMTVFRGFWMSSLVSVCRRRDRRHSALPLRPPTERQAGEVSLSPPTLFIQSGVLALLGLLRNHNDHKTSVHKRKPNLCANPSGHTCPTPPPTHDDHFCGLTAGALLFPPSEGPMTAAHAGRAWLLDSRQAYGRACAECCLARDPYCAWDGAACSRYFPTAKRRTRRQDIRNGDPLTHCSDLQHHDDPQGHSLEERIIYGVENSSTFLECSPKSQRALVFWQFQRQNEDRREEVRVDEHIVRTEQGLLLRSLQSKDAGSYLCQAVEHGFTQTLLKVTLEVIDTERLEELLHRDEDGAGSKAKELSGSATPSQKVWYRDFIQLLNHPNLNTMDEFCEQVWKRDRKQRRQRPGHTQGNSNKWKHLQENKKGRNRRTHEFERAPRSV
ncbi:Semaphorin-3A [Fukomys damarensis]|uniref:Semaphorin-3A n=1 Tax=Fukomys damarensis TaxID=885580 RepID=A0A091EPD0_FUKDA|nr:Semaphorin-3A [Fukomys damarensis]